MKRIVLTASLAAFPTVAQTAEPGAAPTAMSTVTRIGSVTTAFSCMAAPDSGCHYLILAPLCQEKPLADGQKEKTCRYSVRVPAFRLGKGETKAIAGLPADFVYTMRTDRAPTPAEVLAAPIGH